MGNSTIKIKCESPEQREAMLQILMMSKNQLQEHITMLLGRKGIASDTKIKIQDGELIITQKTGDRGIVIVSQGIGYETAGYDTLAENSKYIVVEAGTVKIYLKRPDGIDIELGRFEDLETAVANINSNDIVDAVNNITNPKPSLLENEGNSTNENGNTEATV